MLLAAGVAIAPLFLIVAVTQMALRPGFDITRHAVSSLINGDLGWIQTANFVITGALAILFAIGARTVLHGGRAATWGPILIGAFGIGMIVAGIFPPDPAFGFPMGAPEGAPTNMSMTAALHMLGFFGAFTALIAACFVFARRFAGHARGWAAYSIATGLLAPALIITGTAVFTAATGIFYLAVGIVTFTWLSAVAARLLALPCPRSVAGS
ncbi:hypothetical protein B2K11_00580 [Microbacterium sp. B35-30]|nr:hypothetical protein B2K11_00580 [Microbacterium sp. B35-30]